MYRIQKVLSRLGIVSRRECEALILQRKIKINNQIAILGAKINVNDTVSVNGKLYKINQKFFDIEIRVIAYNKPLGEVVTLKDTHKRKTVFDNLPKIDSKWINVGRLDINTSGLLLFTNEGELAHRLMHPSYGNIRTYHVKVFGKIDNKKLLKAKKGISIGHNEKGYFLAARKLNSDNNFFEITLNRGKYREVRRIFNSLGNKVKELKRVKYSVISLNSLKSGKYRELNKKEIKMLLREVKYI